MKPEEQHVKVVGPRKTSWMGRMLVGILGSPPARAFIRSVSFCLAWLHYSFTPAGRANRAYIRQFKDIHVGERCVIIGNGPSLRNTDLSLLREAYTFGLNRIYLLFDEVGFETTYHVAVNRHVVEQCVDDFRNIKAPLFTIFLNRAFLDGAPDTAYLYSVVGPWFARDVTRGIWEGCTVTYVAMQLAYYMGFSEVVLVGVDHRFAVSGAPNQLVESTGPDASHFDPRYFAKGFKWQLPDLANSEVAYALARKAFENDGRRIIDATVGGALSIFPKVPLEEALRH
ncbi:6-hydroxymethylpterin diphosphokinase MptE-like protein [Mycobacterium sp. E735]|uniref:6-hydroxymethylpterin diphosphokinase MptE-like protein n=1 Tax=Mycobacterium sp. E735 TaxID=1834148 RepID=UPI001E2D475D|nr:6-hydroxymethylpterin diphosphokinase MptE-like protein [Mycobacterium sp. E735]